MNNGNTIQAREGQTHIGNAPFTRQRETIKILANTCPYIGGTAVYKARTLHALYEPDAQYNDRVLCLPQAQNKNSYDSSDNSNMDIDSLNDALALQQLDIANYQQYIENALQQPTGQIDIKITNNNKVQIILYPNPANDRIYISTLNEDATFIVYDLVGNKILETDLKKDISNQQVNLPKVSNGIYSYKISTPINAYTGKLKIIQNE